MKFSEHLSSHLTPEWRSQYISYEVIKEYLYKCVSERTSSYDNSELIAEYFRECDAAFFQKCLQELNKINNFFSEKLSEAKRKFDNLKQELEVYHRHIKSKHHQIGLFSRLSKDGKHSPNGKVQKSNERSVVLNLKENRFYNLHLRKKIKTLHDIKLGFSEFYLSLILLQNYQSLNFTGFRKILKKHDKLFTSMTGFSWRANNVDKSEFHTNREVDDLIVQIETVYTKELESGDRQKAMKRLRVPPLSEQQNPWSTFRLGFFLGIFFIQTTLIIITVYVNYANLPSICMPAVRIFRSSFLVLLFSFLIGVNIYCWRSSGVNHVLIFEIDPRNHLTPVQLMEKSLRLMVLWGSCVIYFLFAPLIGFPAYVGPFVLVISLVIYTINPVPLFNYKSRRWLLSIMRRIVLAPFYSVKFADFWVADQLNSLSFLFVDFGYFICFYGFNIEWRKGFVTSDDLITHNDHIFHPIFINNFNGTIISSVESNVCNGLWYGINPILKALPAWFRFVQCLRRYYDNWSKTHKLFPHVVNAGKYLSSIVVVIVSIFFHLEQSKISMSALIIACVVNSIYTCSWDVLMDWGLFDRDAQDDKILRDELVYQYRVYYYMAIVENIIGRLMWVILISVYNLRPIERDVILSVMMFVEVLRRFIWNFFRLENEHLNNVGEFRAVRDIFIAPIKPYFVTEASEIKLSVLNKINEVSMSAMEQYTDYDKFSEDDTFEKNSEQNSLSVPSKWNFISKNFKRRTSYADSKKAPSATEANMIV